MKISRHPFVACTIGPRSLVNGFASSGSYQRRRASRWFRSTIRLDELLCTKLHALLNLCTFGLDVATVFSTTHPSYCPHSFPESVCLLWKVFALNHSSCLAYFPILLPFYNRKELRVLMFVFVYICLCICNRKNGNQGKHCFSLSNGRSQLTVAAVRDSSRCPFQALVQCAVSNERLSCGFSYTFQTEWKNETCGQKP